MGGVSEFTIGKFQANEHWFILCKGWDPKLTKQVFLSLQFNADGLCWGIGYDYDHVRDVGCANGYNHRNTSRKRPRDEPGYAKMAVQRNARQLVELLATMETLKLD